MTTLLKAAQNGQATKVAQMLSTGADKNQKDTNCQSALWLAAWEGHSAVVQQLLQAKVEVDARDVFGATPLMAATAKGHVDVVQMLLDAGADRYAQDIHDVSAISHAKEKRLTKVLELLEMKHEIQLEREKREVAEAQMKAELNDLKQQLLDERLQREAVKKLPKDNSGSAPAEHALQVLREQLQVEQRQREAAVASLKEEHKSMMSEHMALASEHKAFKAAAVVPPPTGSHTDDGQLAKALESQQQLLQTLKQMLQAEQAEREASVNKLAAELKAEREEREKVEHRLHDELQEERQRFKQAVSLIRRMSNHEEEEPQS